ncbi:hypothetical protein [Actinophytocola sp.]|uniref:hypothetical protein n=1 Tax=Actinophytocola sp. TaxID=1872138 RepID=UPI002D7EF770|nr:hypothetical protein [Actinophytocola sp.]HET9143137.1 hypothetical protein [Actinophytocola sp.]
MRLIRIERRTFTAPAVFLADDGQRAEVDAYFADLTRPFGTEPHRVRSGQSYGEMARELLAAVAPAEPVDLLVLAFSIHDLWPGRATATYLSRLCPGTPLSFAVCDQGSAAPFTGLRIIRDYGAPRALLIVVEQATLPYDSTAPTPAEHRGVAMLFGAIGGPRVTGLRQHPAVAPEAVAGQADRDVTELAAGSDGVRVVRSDALAAAWTGHPDHTTVPAGQPTTGVWWHLADALTGSAGLVVAADYDPDLRYLCLAGIEVR